VWNQELDFECTSSPGRRLSSSYITDASKHVPLTKLQLATIHQPVLILHVCVLSSNGFHSADWPKGENNPTYPLKHAQQLREDLVNSNAMLSVIKGTLYWLWHWSTHENQFAGAAGFMSLTPSSASTLHRIYVDFLGALPSTPSDPTDPNCMKRALGRLAEFAADPSIASRSPKSPMSFSLVSSGVGHSKDLNVGTNTGFSPFPPDCRSERKCVSHLPPFWLAHR
jgi:hypothetical protein